MFVLDVEFKRARISVRPLVGLFDLARVCLSCIRARLVALLLATCLCTCIRVEM